MRLMEIKNNQLSFIKKSHHRVIILLLMIISLLLVSLLLINSSQISSICFKQGNDYSTDVYTENGRVHNERFIEWPFGANIGTITLHEGSIFLFNCSVLANSNSSIEFEYSEELGLENITFFDPDPNDFILAPGESYEETFTIVKGAYEFRSELSYRAHLLTEGGNATVHWWFEVLKYGEASVPGVLFSFGTLTLLAIVVILIAKRRKSS